MTGGILLLSCGCCSLAVKVLTASYTGKYFGTAKWQVYESFKSISTSTQKPQLWELAWGNNSEGKKSCLSKLNPVIFSLNTLGYLV